MAIALDTSGDGFEATSNPTTVSVTVAVATNRLIVVHGGGHTGLASVTYGADTLLTGTTMSGPSSSLRALYFLAPATGANNLVLNWSSGPSSSARAFYSYAVYSGVRQGGQPFATQTVSAGFSSVVTTISGSIGVATQGIVSSAVFNWYTSVPGAYNNSPLQTENVPGSSAAIILYQDTSNTAPTLAWSKTTSGGGGFGGSGRGAIGTLMAFEPDTVTSNTSVNVGSISYSR